MIRSDLNCAGRMNCENIVAILYFKNTKKYIWRCYFLERNKADNSESIFLKVNIMHPISLDSCRTCSGAEKSGIGLYLFKQLLPQRGWARTGL